MKRIQHSMTILTQNVCDINFFMNISSENLKTRKFGQILVKEQKKVYPFWEILKISSGLNGPDFQNPKFWTLDEVRIKQFSS